MYWLGIMNPPLYNVIDAHELILDEKIERKFLLSGVAMLGKVVAGKATASETVQAQAAKAVLKVKDKPRGERFDILREDLIVREDFFFALEDMRLIDHVKTSTSRLAEYLSEEEADGDVDAADDESEYSGTSDDHYL